MHETDVAVVQLLVAQFAFANTAVNVVAAGAKLMPAKVTLAKAETTLYGDDAVNTGADGQVEMVGRTPCSVNPKT